MCFLRIKPRNTFPFDTKKRYIGISYSFKNPRKLFSICFHKYLLLNFFCIIFYIVIPFESIIVYRDMLYAEDSKWYQVLALRQVVVVFCCCW